mmetsp:Transcript_18074/g.28082  ORF Transcript_18074/g.28082 Transcript_18074/m.28082 type:complete len:153 (-) Transcript_18074:1338-1796(-)
MAKDMQMHLLLLQGTNEEGLDVTTIIKLMMNHHNPLSVIDTQSKTVVDNVSEYGEQHSTAARQPFETSAGLLQLLKQGTSTMAFISQPQAQALLATANVPSLANLASTVPGSDSGAKAASAPVISYPQCIWHALTATTDVKKAEVAAELNAP